MSMGGYGTYHFAFKYPQLFCAAGPFSAGGPYVNGAPHFDNYSPADDPHKLVVANAAILSAQMRLYISVGSTDLGLVPYNKDLADSCKNNKIPYVFTVVPNVGHDLNGQMQVDGLQSVQYITQGFMPVPVANPTLSGSNTRYQTTIALAGSNLRIATPFTQAMTIKLVTIDGKIAGSHRTTGQNISLNLSTFARGAYCVLVHSASGIMEKRIFLAN
jgi:hypothetical protein